jgi:hypothetical protein
MPPILIDFLFLVNVATLVGLPPGLPAARFLLTADAFSPFVIRVAFASGTHFGYFRFEPEADFLPQGWYLPFFFGAPMSTHFWFTHFFKSPIIFSFYF